MKARNKILRWIETHCPVFAGCCKQRDPFLPLADPFPRLLCATSLRITVGGGRSGHMPVGGWVPWVLTHGLSDSGEYKRGWKLSSQNSLDLLCLCNEFSSLTPTGFIVIVFGKFLLCFITHCFPEHIFAFKHMSKVRGASLWQCLRFPQKLPQNVLKYFFTYFKYHPILSS